MATKKIVRLSVLLLSLFAATAAQAVAVKYQCSFSTASNIDGSLEVGEPFLLEFSYDTITGAAVMVGNQGVANVTAIIGADALGATDERWITFAEVTPSGVVHTTTVFNQMAVHSRNTVMLGKLNASQFYGICLVGT